MSPKHFSILALGLMTAMTAYAKPTWQTSKANDWRQPILADNTAALVFIRADQSMDEDASTNIAVNNRYLTSLDDNHYSTDVVCAGEAKISAAPTKAFTNDLEVSAINVVLQPKQVQFVYVEVDSQYRPTLRAISEQEALPLIVKSNRQIHQISRTAADNCPVFATPAPIPTPVTSTYTPPPVVSIAGTENTTTPSIRLNIHFDHDKSVIKANYKSEIARAADFLANYPTMNALVEGHTDATGDVPYNQALSQSRAAAVRQALIKEHNIDPSRLRAVGYGESRPIANNSTADGRSENRRVVISIPDNN